MIRTEHYNTPRINKIKNVYKKRHYCYVSTKLNNDAIPKKIIVRKELCFRCRSSQRRN